MSASQRGQVRIGISGFSYPSWRGRFYPDGLAPTRFLAFAAERFDTIEINRTFYRLASPDVFSRWDAIPRGDTFRFAVKGSRFITHNLKLARVDEALANFCASGILALGKTMGPFLWQLPPTLPFDPVRLEAFIDRLPRNTAEAERLAARFEPQRVSAPLLRARMRCRMKHAFEVRHPSYFCDAFFELLRERGCAFTIADSQGRYPYAEEVTADFVYARLHRGAGESGEYTEAELATWALRIARWSRRGSDVYVYFDNDFGAFAPKNALRLIELLGPAVARRAA